MRIECMYSTYIMHYAEKVEYVCLILLCDQELDYGSTDILTYTITEWIIILFISARCYMISSIKHYDLCYSSFIIIFLFFVNRRYVKLKF